MVNAKLLLSIKGKIFYTAYNWNLANDDVNYYSSAIFYKTGIDKFGFSNYKYAYLYKYF